MEMEEMMISRRSSPANLRIQSISSDPLTNCRAWKLYENPFYTNTPHNQKLHPQQKQHKQHSCELENKGSSNGNSCSTDQLKQIHRLQLPISARKIAASFWDLTFIRPLMESELDMARAKITELKAELELELKARKKAESMNKKLAREILEFKKSSEALKRLCEELAKEVSSDKAEMNRMHKDMEEERKMLRIAEVLREERVQMKLADAKLLLEQKLTELEATKTKQIVVQSNITDQQAQHQRHNCKANDGSNKTCSSSSDVVESVGNINCFSHDFSVGEEIKSCVLVEKPAPTTTAIIAVDSGSGSNASAVIVAASQRRASPEPENPHIKRGIKGFVEFPKVVRALGSKSRHFGTKLESQKAQLKILLLKQKTPIRASNGTTLVTS